MDGGRETTKLLGDNRTAEAGRKEQSCGVAGRRVVQLN